MTVIITFFFCLLFGISMLSTTVAERYKYFRFRFGRPYCYFFLLVTVAIINSG